MFLKCFRLNVNFSGSGAALLLLVLTQIPLAINQTLVLGCILTTWSDYAEFWTWKDIPLDARVRFCTSGFKTTNEIQSKKTDDLLVK